MDTYALMCGGREDQPRTCRVRTVEAPDGWHAVITWTYPGGSTVASVGRTTRREAVRAARAHLRDRRANP